MNAIGRPPGVGNVVIKIDDDLHARARALAVRRGKSWRDWVEEAIAEKAEREQQEQADAERRRRSR
jgi:predicted HicB family RNase H-like nuclease